MKFRCTVIMISIMLLCVSDFYW